MRLLFLFVLFSTVQVSAQQIYISEGQKLSSEMVGYDILGKGPAGELFVYKKYRFEDEVDVFDKQMNLKRTRNITLKGINYDTNELIKMGDRIFQFYTERSGRTSYLKFQEYNLALENKGDPVLVDSTVSRIGEAWSEYKVQRSEPDEYILCYKFSLNNGRMEQTYLQILNREGKMVSQSQFYLPAGNDTYELLTTQIGRGGQPAFLFRNNSYNCKKDEDGIHYWIAFPGNGGKLSTCPISNAGDQCIKELNIGFDEARNILVAAGFTGEDNRYSMQGYTVIHIDPLTGLVTSEKNDQFSDELSSSITSMLDKYSRYIPAYQVTRVIPRMDGGALLVAEYYDKTVENYDYTNYDPYYGYRTSTRQVEFYEYSDILLLSTGPEGKLDWSNIIRKKQLSKEDKGVNSSFGLMNSYRNLYFIFNEDISQNSNVLMYALSADGTLDRQSLFNPSKQEVELRPVAARQIDFDEVIIPSIYKRTLAFVKVKL